MARPAADPELALHKTMLDDIHREFSQVVVANFVLEDTLELP
jgi:hypothetical protein